MTRKPMWRAVVLAAGRGASDPMAKAFGVTHKCTIPIAGKPMMRWVLDSLQNAGFGETILVVSDNQQAARDASQSDPTIRILPAENSAPASALAALHTLQSYPTLITTGDHPLLTTEMLAFVKAKAESSDADILVCLATAETILGMYPENKRTFFNLAGTQVSGCNVFAVMTPKGLKLLELWQHLERHRKQPWKLVAAFGIMPLVWYVFGLLTPDRAFNHISKILGITVKPLFMPFAEAAIDVDKPSDHALAEMILLQRLNPA